jgi:hypothetical protein
MFKQLRALALLFVFSGSVTPSCVVEGLLNTKFLVFYRVNSTDRDAPRITAPETAIVSIEYLVNT